MMKKWLLTFIITGLWLQTVKAEEIIYQTMLVVVNPNSQLTQLSEKQVMSLFLGRSKFLPNGGGKVKAIDYPIDSSERATFYQALTGKNIADIDAYWARLKYSGRVSPPQALENSRQILQMVAEQDTAIAYLPSQYEDSIAQSGLQTVLTMQLN